MINIAGLADFMIDKLVQQEEMQGQLRAAVAAIGSLLEPNSILRKNYEQQE
jgi:hypothetical protein